MRVLTKTAMMGVSVLAIGLAVGSAQARPPGPGGARPESAVQKVQTLQEIDRDQARARVRQRLGERWEAMTPAERLRARHRARQTARRLEERWAELTPAERAQVRHLARQAARRAEARWEAMSPAERMRAKQRARQIGERIEERSGYGYTARKRARDRLRDRLE
ncbi:MAG TPA: hypothetical protein VFZ16_22680 [Hyphomicrobiaceae bacterium]|nr:hypothetical protein [Hyphomicrobiaceae bacterium]